MIKNKYIFKDKNGKERVVYALTYGEAMKQLRPKQNDLYELLETVYNVDIYTYNIHVLDFDIYQDVDITYYEKDFVIYSVERLYKQDELRDQVIQYLTDTIELDTRDYVEASVSDVNFTYEVK